MVAHFIGCLLPSHGTFISAQRVILEIDDVPVVGVAGMGIDFLATNIGEDCFLVIQTVGQQTIHFSGRSRHALGVGIVKSEAHAQDDAPLETLDAVYLESLRVFVAARMEQKGGYIRDRPAIKELGPLHNVFRNMDDADHHSSLTGPAISCA